MLVGSAIQIFVSDLFGPVRDSYFGPDSNLIRYVVRISVENVSIRSGPEFDPDFLKVLGRESWTKNPDSGFQSADWTGPILTDDPAVHDHKTGIISIKRLCILHWTFESSHAPA